MRWNSDTFVLFPTVSEGAPTPFSRQKTVTETERNIPEGTVALQEGAQVFSSDGKHVGDVERVFIYPRTDHASHFLISKGLLLKEVSVLVTFTGVAGPLVHLAREGKASAFTCATVLERIWMIFSVTVARFLISLHRSLADEVLVLRLKALSTVCAPDVGRIMNSR